MVILLTGRRLLFALLRAGLCEHGEHASFHGIGAGARSSANGASAGPGLCRGRRCLKID